MLSISRCCFMIHQGWIDTHTYTFNYLFKFALMFDPSADSDCMRATTTYNFRTAMHVIQVQANIRLTSFFLSFCVQTFASLSLLPIVFFPYANFTYFCYHILVYITSLVFFFFHVWANPMHCKRLHKIYFVWLFHIIFFNDTWKQQIIHNLLVKKKKLTEICLRFIF